ncbi:MAG: hypothetical protein DRH57_03800 [Candidatus Cloacimonadota bacterium]|nr:MAG: hypothetical protein DRH57_03800 [Candidatus Cloacimonadota bacterium]
MQNLFNQHIEYPSFEEILNEYSKEADNYLPKEGNVFGFWMQTLADIQFLDLELSGLTKDYKIDALNHKVYFNDDYEYIIKRIAHLDLVDSKPTLYSYLIDLFGDTNAYAFHNLYPYKGKFYPRIVRTIINAYDLQEGDLILDPYNGCGTTTHEAGLMGIDSIGIDINPIGNIISELKNELLFVDEKEYELNTNDLVKIFDYIENKKRTHKNDIMYKLFLMLYFDTKDAFIRTTRYNKKGMKGLFIEKFNYIKDCYNKTKKYLKEWNINYKKAIIKEGNVLDLKSAGIDDETIDAIITSPPYYFSLDYVGKDKIAYDYLNEIKFFNYKMEDVKKEYLGMKIKPNIPARKLLEKRVITYFDDLEKSIQEMARVLKPGGKIAIVIGDSTLNGRKLPTTHKTNDYCLKYGLKHIRSVFNPLLGTRNRAIRGESILLYYK